MPKIDLNLKINSFSIQARNKIDGRNYAIKRIKLNSKYTHLDHEVELLSKLNHVNVIRYYSTWIENVTLGPEDDLSDDEPFSDSSKAQATKNEYVSIEKIIILKKN